MSRGKGRFIQLAALFLLAKVFVYWQLIIHAKITNMERTIKNWTRGLKWLRERSKKKGPGPRPAELNANGIFSPFVMDFLYEVGIAEPKDPSARNSYSNLNWIHEDYWVAATRLEKLSKDYEHDTRQWQRVKSKMEKTDPKVTNDVVSARTYELYLKGKLTLKSKYRIERFKEKFEDWSGSLHLFKQKANPSRSITSTGVNKMIPGPTLDQYETEKVITVNRSKLIMKLTNYSDSALITVAEVVNDLIHRRLKHPQNSKDMPVKMVIAVHGNGDTKTFPSITACAKHFEKLKYDALYQGLNRHGSYDYWPWRIFFTEDGKTPVEPKESEASA